MGDSYTVKNQDGIPIISSKASNSLVPYGNATAFPTYTVSRTLTAQGLSAGTGIGDAVGNAKEWCLFQIKNQSLRH